MMSNDNRNKWGGYNSILEKKMNKNKRLWAYPEALYATK